VSGMHDCQLIAFASRHAVSVPFHWRSTPVRLPAGVDAGDRLRTFQLLRGLRRTRRRFVVVSAPRTGSTYIASALKEHPAVDFVGSVLDLNGLDEPALRSALNDPVSYLASTLQGTRKSLAGAVGFKLHYNDSSIKSLSPDNRARARFLKNVKASRHLVDQASRRSTIIRDEYDLPGLETRFHALWSHLRADEGLYVIHVKRRNLLKQCLSLRLAFMTNEWSKTSDAARPMERPRVRLSYDSCLRHFEQARAEESRFDELFAGHPVLQVSYESFFQDPDDGLERIQRFLGLAPKSLPSPLRKQEDRHLREAIESYEDLKRQFRDTPHAWYFEE